MARLESLTIGLEARSERLQSGLRKGRNAVRRFSKGSQDSLDRLQKTASRVTGVLGGVAAGLAGGAAVNAIREQVSQAAEYATLLERTSRATSLNIGQTQAYGVALQQLGKDQDSVNDLFIDLADRLQEVRDGTASYVEDFALIGLAAEDFQNLNIEQSLQRIEEQFINVGGAGNQAAQAFSARIFSEFQHVLGTISTSAASAATQLEKVGVTIDANDVARMAEFRRQTELISESFEAGVLTRFARDLDISEDKLTNIQALGARVGKVLGEAGAALAEGIASGLSAFEQFLQEREAAIRESQGRTQQERRGRTDRGTVVALQQAAAAREREVNAIRDVILASQDLDRTSARRRGVLEARARRDAEALVEVFENLPPIDTSGVDDVIEMAASGIVEALDTGAQMIPVSAAKMKMQLEELAASVFPEEGTIGDIARRQRRRREVDDTIDVAAAGNPLQALVDSLPEPDSSGVTALLDELDMQFEMLQDSALGVAASYDPVLAAQLRYAEESKILKEALDAAAISQDVYNDAIENAKESLDEAVEPGLFDGFGERLKGTVRATIVNLDFDDLGDIFDNIFAGIANELQASALDHLLNSIDFDMIFSQIGRLFGAIFGGGASAVPAAHSGEDFVNAGGPGRETLRRLEHGEGVLNVEDNRRRLSGADGAQYVFAPQFIGIPDAAVDEVFQRRYHQWSVQIEEDFRNRGTIR